MSFESELNRKDESPHLPEWEDCDYFCIHDYAGVGVPCGWRGRLHEVRPGETGTKLRCPRCGCATLLRIPLDRDNTTVP